MMTVSFNLSTQPWIPCLADNGTQVELSLSQCFAQAHELRELGGESPLVTVALYRLLLAILHRVHKGPESKEEWGALWQAGRFDAARIQNYLDAQHDHFDLFHPARPFFQSTDKKYGELALKSVTSLIHDAASGNNATLFDHHIDQEEMDLTPAQAARYLLAAQAFGLAGLSGLTDKFSYAPCVGGVLFLVQGDTLFETLLLNLIPYDKETPFKRKKEDVPIWEMSDPFQPRSAPNGYLDYLTWQNRRVLFDAPKAGEPLFVRKMTMAPGMKIEGEFPNPMMYYRKDKERGYLPLRFNEARALWRDSSALFRLRHEGHRPPLVLDWLAEVEDRYLPKGQRQRILALGMSNDQAKTEFFRSEVMPLRREYLQAPTMVDDLDRLLKLADDVARQLWGAASTLANFILAPEQDLSKAESGEKGKGAQSDGVARLIGSWGMERAYWSQLEVPFRHVLETLPDDVDKASSEWKAILYRIARSAFNTISENLDSSPRSLKAVVNAEGQLEAGLRKLLLV